MCVECRTLISIFEYRSVHKPSPEFSNQELKKRGCISTCRVHGPLLSAASQGSRGGGGDGLTIVVQLVLVQ